MPGKRRFQIRAGAKTSKLQPINQRRLSRASDPSIPLRTNRPSSRFPRFPSGRTERTEELLAGAEGQDAGFEAGGGEVEEGDGLEGVEAGAAGGAGVDVEDAVAAGDDRLVGVAGDDDFGVRTGSGVGKLVDE